MRTSVIIFILSVLISAASCTNGEWGYSGLGPSVTGCVNDIDGNPIEHIQVTLEWEGKGIKDISYTSSEGIFKSEAHLSNKGETMVTITLEDIDGDENGGQFETVVENIVLFEEDLQNSVTDSGEINLGMVFHLNRATL